MSLLVCTTVAAALGILGFAAAHWVMTIGRRYEEEYVSKASGLLQTLHAPVSAKLVLQGGVFTAALGGLLGFALTRSWIVATALGAFGALFPLAYLRMLARVRRRKFQEQLPEIIAQTRTAVACGYTLPMALAMSQRQVPAPASQELRVLLGHLRLGMPLVDALARLQQRMPGEDLDLFVGAITLAERSGGQLGRILSNIEQTVRDRLRLEKKLRAMTARGRMESWIISLCPVGLGAGMYALNPDLMGKFFAHPAALPLVAVGCGFVVASYFIIRKILTPEF